MDVHPRAMFLISIASGASIFLDAFLLAGDRINAIQKPSDCRISYAKSSASWQMLAN